MKKKKALLLIFVLSCLSLWAIAKHHPKVGPEQAKGIWVSGIKVQETAIPSVLSALGTVTARNVEITPELAGHIKGILFKDGAEVKAGTALFQLDDTIYRTKYELAKAKLFYSTTNHQRMQQLGKQGAISKLAIDQAEADFKEKKADADENEVMVKKMRLMAPFDGQLGKSKVNLGDYVTVGQSVVTLTDTKRLRVEYAVPEKYLPSLKLGQAVTITHSAYPNTQFIGTVAYISPTINVENRSVSIYATVANDKRLLAPGMFVNVMQSLGDKERALMIPSRSLVPAIEGQQVYKVIDGKAYAVTVIIGKRLQENVQVLEGLKTDDLIITDGQLKVKNGTPVQLKT